MIIYQALHAFFEERLRELECEEEIKAYVIATLAKYKQSFIDYSNEPITLVYARAQNNQDFKTFQDIGDYLLMVSGVYPEHLKNASKGYYYSVAQMSYYNCYKLLHRKLKVYELMADRFIDISTQINISLKISLK
jgi:hypothetical protein